MIPTPDEAVAPQRLTRADHLKHAYDHLAFEMRRRWDGSESMTVELRGLLPNEQREATETLRSRGWVARWAVEEQAPCASMFVVLSAVRKAGV